MIHSTYLPFTADQLAPHFADARHVNYFVISATRYIDYLARMGALPMPITPEVRLARQIEKDERFWTACTLKTVFDAGQMANILQTAFGDRPPLTGFASWEECVGDKHDQELRFEVAISSPQSYRDSLQNRFDTTGDAAHLIPYVVHAAQANTAFEGPTKVDAVFRNRLTGFSVMFEAKLLSDISCEVTFDPFRNQLARNLDVMIDRSESFLTPDPAQRLLVLLTPQVFKNKRSTRYYGMLYDEYHRNPARLAEHLPHREVSSLRDVPRRLGWLTFEECQGICKTCCPWLATQGGQP